MARLTIETHLLSDPENEAAVDLAVKLLDESPSTSMELAMQGARLAVLWGKNLDIIEKADPSATSSQAGRNLNTAYDWTIEVVTSDPANRDAEAMLPVGVLYAGERALVSYMAPQYPEIAERFKFQDVAQLPHIEDTDI